jgi:hypothetical protein
MKHVEVGDTVQSCFAVQSPDFTDKQLAQVVADGKVINRSLGRHLVQPVIALHFANMSFRLCPVSS